METKIRDPGHQAIAERIQVKAVFDGYSRLHDDDNETWGFRMSSKKTSAICGATLLLAAIFSGPNVLAEGSDYMIQPGDVLAVSVWKELDLQQQVVVRPDGKFTFPLAGETMAAGRSVNEVTHDLVEGIGPYIPDPVVTVQVQQIVGNKIYVLGKVLRPGEFLMTQEIDVMQAIAQAGGMATFAEENEISIIRRENGTQSSIPFRFGDVKYGRNLEQNILLKPGDVVVVP